MNDRAQGGAADVSGKAQIEIMQHRRLSVDDNKGVIEPLNETDSDGYGVKVTARYFMQIFNFVKAPSKQRNQQILIDQPLIYNFAFNYSIPENKTKAEQFKSQIQLFKGNQSMSSLTYHTFPLGLNKILVRFENLADRFDHLQSDTKYINVKQFASQFYKEANPLSKKNPPIARIQETTIDHSQTQAELDKKKAKFKWAGEGDKESGVTQIMKKPADKNALTEIAMEPQRIRTFVIDYSPLIVNKTTGQVIVKQVKETKNVTANVTKPVTQNITGGPFKQKK